MYDYFCEYPKEMIFFCIFFGEGEGIGEFEMAEFFLGG